MSWHIHWTDRWSPGGVYVYRECRCGARKTVRWISKGYSPIRRGWPTVHEGWVR